MTEDAALKTAGPVVPTPSKDGWRPYALEALVSFGTAALFLASCVLIRVYPLDRLGQISGLASLGLRMFLFGVPLCVALAVSMRRNNGRGFDMTNRLVCAAIAGLAGAMIGGGVLVALRGTPFGINGQGGDIGYIAKWAAGIDIGEPIPPTYPPLSLYVLNLYSKLVGLPTEFAVKHLQIAGTAAIGPIAYLSWRIWFRPTWALAIGGITMIPLVEPYKPFPNLVLVIFVPVALLFLDRLRTVHEREMKQVVRSAIGFGVSFGALCLMYSGWFQWSAPGLFVAAAVVFPWRSARGKGAVFLGVTGAVFTVLTIHYVIGMLGAGAIKDNYVYFDVTVEPMYIAMWRNDTPGDVGVWPPPGEVGGVGLFSLFLAIGLGSAVAFARKSTLVLGAIAMMAGAWLMRFFYARTMFDTKLVQLYPRTTPLILLCLMLLTGFAVHTMIQRVRADHPVRSPSGALGAACALLLVFASAGSATANRWMPLDGESKGAGWLTFNAHRAKWAKSKRVHRSYAMPWIRRASTTPLPPPAR